MRFLRTNTAVIVTVGPFYDKTDGVTIKTALTITNERITLTADTDAGSAPTNILDNIAGATAATANNLNYITGNDAGMMQLELAAADTNRLGRMFLSITDAANHVPVFHEFMVLPAMIYDAFVLGTDVLDSSMTQILGTAVSTPATAGILDVNVKNIDNDAASASGTVTFPNATLASTTNITAGTIATVTTLTNLPTITANWLTAAGTATDFGAELAAAIWGDTTAGDFTVALSIGKSIMNGVALGTGLTINAYTGNTVQTGDSFARIGAAGAGLTAIDLPNQTMDIIGNITGNVSGSVGSVTGAVGSVTGAVGSVAGAVGSVTGLTASNLDVAVSTLATAANLATVAGFVDTEVAAILAAVDTEVAAIKTQTDKLTFTVANQLDSNIQYVNDVLVTGNGAPGTEWGP